ncbi:MAG: AraC family transcriptional regulator, partial [Proteobacteria bacterium]
TMFLPNRTECCIFTAQKAYLSCPKVSSERGFTGMSELSQTLIALVERAAPTEGFHKSKVPGMDFIRFSAPKPWGKAHWRASFVIVVQGFKDIELESNIYQYKDAHTITTPIDLPVSSRIPFASVDKPFLAIRMTLNLLAFNEVAANMKLGPVETTMMKTYGIFGAKASEAILESAIRLSRLFDSDQDADVLGPILVREMYYHLLKSENGAAICQFAADGSKLNSIAETIKSMRRNLSAKLDIDQMAKAARMSRTSFFAAFKQVTAMSPIQYQKKFRLMEARQLLIMEGETAENAAFRVGYKSASQFSREYSRMFGNTPGHDIARHLASTSTSESA